MNEQTNIINAVVMKVKVCKVNIITILTGLSLRNIWKNNY